MRKQNRQAIAILGSDLHEWHSPPVFRSNEPDWFAACKRPLDQVKLLQTKLGGVPFLISGDIFNLPYPEPETINFLIENMPPDTIAIPGQHDLPFHELENIKKSGFRTLQLAGAISKFSSPYISGANIYEAPWGTDLDAIDTSNASGIRILLCHRYVWQGKARHAKATPISEIKKLEPILQKFDVAVFGDNHQSFDTVVGNCKVVNVGAFMRLKLDEKENKPRVVVLWDDMELETVYLDCSKDVYLEIETSQRNDDNEMEGTSSEFLKELETLDSISLDFVELARGEITRTRGNKDRWAKILEEVFIEYKGEGK